MISSFTIGNFKAFGPAQTIPLKPITLIFGPNSAGKSSILHSLLFAHEALRNGDLDVRQTAIGGQSVDLGGFEQLTHRCNSDNSVTLEFRFPTMAGRNGIALRLEEASIRATLQMQRSTLGTGDDIVDESLRTLGLSFVDNSPAETVKVLERFLAERLTGETSTPVLRRFEITAGGETLIQTSRRGDRGMKVDRLATSHPQCRQFIEALVVSYSTTQTFDTADAATVEKALADLLPDIELDEFGLLARPKKGLDMTVGFEMAAIGRENRADALRNLVRQFAPRLIQSLFDLADNSLEAFFSSLEYLGPLRSYPPRHLSLETITEVGKSEGVDAWRIVLRDAAIRDKVNRWLSSEFLTTKYELGVNSLVPLHLAAEALETEFAEIVSERSAAHDEARRRIGDAESEELYHNPYDGSQWDTSALFRRMLWQMIQRSSRSAVPELTLLDKRTGTFVSHRDIGIGVSQLLPVLVKAYASRNKVITIEQPEIHLHPALQAELADAFIESSLGGQQNTFILETHSEHLILRILRRIRETRQKRLPDGCPPLHPDDVSILYVQPAENGSEVRVLRVDEMGKLLDPWPGGFFEESFRELF